jgi:anti-sigma B factor antagonist/stage II sporulation protein AA (anti-sigma F factor antagonist)
MSDIQTEIKGTALVVTPQAKLMDDEQLKALSAAIDKGAGSSSSGISLVVIDLAKVQLLPSLALGLLVQVSSKCKARQQKLKLAAVQPVVRQVFAITRLDRVFEFSPSVDAAIE